MAKTIDTLSREEKARRRSKAWHEARKTDPEYNKKRAEYSKEYRKNNPEKRLLRGAIDRARQKGIECSICLEDIVIPDVCPILKTKFQYGTPYAASLDRIDSTKGYIKGNVWVISWKANAMKQDATREELERFADWVNKLIV